MKSRPHISINMAMSADGKISTRRRESFSLGSSEDRRLMDTLRAQADAVVVGASTVRHDGWAIRVRTREIREKRLARGRSPHPLNVVVSRALDLPAKSQFFTHPRTERLVITTKAAPATRVRRFAKLAEVVVLPRKTIRAVDIVDTLAERGVKRLLVEGGGELNYSLFAEELVDELYLTITARIIGGGDAPTPVDGKGFLEATQKPLTLVSSRRRGDEVFLRYRVG
jgi:2,5-diamino-6-(ribosylamino)-4(3H)-pyrimidinone 5'-phosphate reductase